MSDYNGDERRGDHNCIHEQRWGEFMEWKKQTQELISRFSGMFIQSYIQMFLMLAGFAAVVWLLVKK